MEPKPTGARIHLSLFNLIIEIEQDGIYPDQVQDIANRAVQMFQEALAICKINQLDIRDFQLEDDE
jgi:hypothetical protein